MKATHAAMTSVFLVLSGNALAQKRPPGKRIDPVFKCCEGPIAAPEMRLAIEQRSGAVRFAPQPGGTADDLFTRVRTLDASQGLTQDDLTTKFVVDHEFRVRVLDEFSRPSIKYAPKIHLSEYALESYNKYSTLYSMWTQTASGQRLAIPNKRHYGDFQPRFDAERRLAFHLLLALSNPLVIDENLMFSLRYDEFATLLDFLRFTLENRGVRAAIEELQQEESRFAAAKEYAPSYPGGLIGTTKSPDFPQSMLGHYSHLAWEKLLESILYSSCTDREMLPPYAPRDAPTWLSELSDQGCKVLREAFSHRNGN